MRWPWKRRKLSDSLVVSWAGQSLVYVRARLREDGLHEVLQLGVERQSSDSADEFAKRLSGLGLRGFDAHVMLRPEQYQVLQIEAPAVAPEEMRAAARWQIRDMVDQHMDDITLDVMRVGGGKVGAGGQLFVVVAGNAVLAEVLRLGQTLQWEVPVVDIQETAQRNLQTLLARQDGRVERANAALMMLNEHQALLTISANGELFYSRRIDLAPDFLDKPWQQDAAGAFVVDEDAAQRFLVEIQRSLDVWDRTWSDLPLDGLWVEAGVRTQEMATWLSKELGFTVRPMLLDGFFPGFESGSASVRALCLPLLGVLLRTEERDI